MIEIFEKLKAYNFWDKKKVEVGFLRKTYLKRMDQFLGNKLIKVLVGQRRTGKSYLLRQLIQKLHESGTPRQNIFYLNKEIIDFSPIKTAKNLADLIALYRKKIKPKGKVFILLDEVQEIEKWEKVVNSLSQDYRTPYEVIITGSNASMLSSDLATYLTGRYVQFPVAPFSFEEYCAFTKQEVGRKTLFDYLKTGGLPELLRLPENEMRYHYLISLRDTIFLKDIIKRYRIRDVALLEQLFSFLLDNIGNLFSANALVKLLKGKGYKTNVETLSEYLHALTQSLLFHEVSRYDIKGKSVIMGPKKYYVNDLAFRNYLASSFDSGLGKHLENVVYKHFLSHDYRVYIGTIGKAEVDFVVERGQKKKYIQVAYTLTESDVMKREVAAFVAIPDHHEKIIISLDDGSPGTINGIRHIPAWEFLTSPDDK